MGEATKTAKKTAKPRRSTAGRIEIAKGIEVPADVDRYRVMRCDPVHPFNPRTPCAVPLGGMRVDLFEIAQALPSVDEVKKVWGSGAYRFAWFRGTAPAGTSPVMVIDDPTFPQKPVYLPPVAAAAPVASPVAAAAGPSPLDMLKALATSEGMVPMAAVAMLISVMQSSVTAQGVLFEHSRALDREAREQAAADFDQRLRQQAQWHDQQQKAVTTFWAEQAKLAREVNASGGGGDDIDELRDMMTELATAVKGQSEQLSFWEKMALEHGGGLIELLKKPPEAPAIAAAASKAAAA